MSLIKNKKAVLKFSFLILGLVAIVAIVAFAGGVFATEESDVIIKAADRIIDLQYTDGSWDWIVTGATGPTGTTYRNIAGVTAEVLLDAYEITGDDKYLDAAENTGDYIVGFTISKDNRYNAFNINFLYHLTDATGDDKYSDHADDLMDHILDEENYWSNHNGNHCDDDATDGCTAEELLEALKNYRSGAGDPNGIVVWDLFHFVEAGQNYGDTGFADDIAEEIDDYMDDSNFNNTIEYYEIGLAGGIIGLYNAGEDYSDYLTDLLGEQNGDGSFGDSTEAIQTTAYALMAINYVGGDQDAQNDAAAYLLDKFGYTGSDIDGWKEGDGNEYSEVTSEAAQALFEYDYADPVASDLVVEKLSEQCKIDIEALITDEASFIEEAEYFLGGSTCGAPGTGTPMDAKDGDFDELIEEVIANEVGVSDGSLNIHVQGKDAAGHWSNCVSVQKNIDCLPPNYPTCNGGEEGIAINGVCNADELLVCGIDPFLTAKICDTQSRIQMAEYFIDEDSPLNWHGINMTASDGAYDEKCEDVEDYIDISQLEEGTHYVQLHGKDGQENWGKFDETAPIVSFIKDTTAPSTDKDIEYTQDAYVECQYISAMEETLTNGCYYVLPGTRITLSAQDPDPQQTEEFAGNVIINYKIWYSNEDDCSTAENWTILASGQSGVDEPIELILTEDSCHLIEYWAEDLCGNEEEHHFELDIVDNKAPVTTKTVSDPKIPGDGYPIDYYITEDTTITLSCEDQNPHPVGYETLYWWLYWKENCDDQEWELIDGSEYYEPSSSVEITDLEDSCHLLKYYCMDGLGNVENSSQEMDVVDNQAPIIEKEIVGPWYGECPPEEQGDICFIDGVTEILVNATDPEPHPVDDVRCEWAYLLDGYDFYGWYDTFPIIFPEETEHQLIISCWDALGNGLDDQYWDYETFLVDHTPPTTTKWYEGPEYYDPTGAPPYPKWITSQTAIGFLVDDTGPHKSGIAGTYYRVTLVDEVNCLDQEICQLEEGDGSWSEYEGPFTISHESCHLIEYYSIDNVDKKETTKKQCVFVDNTPPETDKEVGEPRYVCEDYGFDIDECGLQGEWPAWYVKTTTPITLSCEDSLPHPVDHEILCYRVSLDEGGEPVYITQNYIDGGFWKDEITYCVPVDEYGEYTFNFLEESLHNLEWYCEDALYNEGELQIEWDNVDDTPPEIIVHNPTPDEAENVTRCTQSIVIETWDEKSGVNESSVYAELINSEDDVVEHVVLTKTIYGTYEGLMSKEHPVGEYTLSICASDNLGNQHCEEIEEYLPEMVNVNFIDPSVCVIDPETGGDCDFAFNLCMRDGNSLQFWMNKLGIGGITPDEMNAIVSSDLPDEAFVGLKHPEPQYTTEYDCVNAPSFVGEYVWEDGICYWQSDAEILSLEIEPICHINGKDVFNLHLEIGSDAAEEIGTGVHDLEYWIKTSIQPDPCIEI